MYLDFLLIFVYNLGLHLLVADDNVDHFLGCHLFLLVFVLSNVIVSLRSKTILNLNLDQRISYFYEITALNFQFHKCIYILSTSKFKCIMIIKCNICNFCYRHSNFYMSIVQSDMESEALHTKSYYISMNYFIYFFTFNCNMLYFLFLHLLIYVVIICKLHLQLFVNMIFIVQIEVHSCCLTSLNF
jgi:hypothetical protein